MEEALQGIDILFGHPGPLLFGQVEQDLVGVLRDLRGRGFLGVASWARLGPARATANPIVNTNGVRRLMRPPR